MVEDIKEVLDKLDVCRKGQCWNCPYSLRDKQCTDTLIDDCYDILKELYDIIKGVTQ